MRLTGRTSITRRLTALFVIAASSVLLALGLVIASSVEQHFEEQDMELLTGKMRLAQHTLQIGLTVFLIAGLGYGLRAAFWSNIASSGFAFLALLPVAWRSLRPAYDFRILRDLLGFGLPFVPSTVAVLITELSDRFLVKFYVGLEGATVYGVGYKFGLPSEADLVFDARFLANPNFVPKLRRLTGADAPVISFLRRKPDTQRFLKRVLELVGFVLPRHEREGRSYLTLAIGCTGGRHRSVMLANAIGAAVKKKGFPVRVVHRDLGQE